jgi:SnoaL-like polyketide cyclase
MDNVEVVRTVEGLWESGKLDELDQYFAEGFNPASLAQGFGPGIEAAKQIHGFSGQFLDGKKVEIVEIFGAGDKVCSRQRMTFTNTKGVPWFGAAANGAKVEMNWISVYTLKDGKIVDHAAVLDGFAMLAGIGLWSPPQMA